MLLLRCVASILCSIVLVNNGSFAATLGFEHLAKGVVLARKAVEFELSDGLFVHVGDYPGHDIDQDEAVGYLDFLFIELAPDKGGSVLLRLCFQH